MFERGLPAVFFKILGTVVLIVSNDVYIFVTGIPVSGSIEVIAVPFPDEVMTAEIFCKCLIGVLPEFLINGRAFLAPPEP